VDHEINRLIATNQAIAELIAREGDDESNARIVIAFGHPLPVSKPVEAALAHHSEGSSIKGSSPGIGEVEIEEGEKKREYSYGTEKGRVGNYRLWKPEQGVICFHHFWASDLTTAADEKSLPPTYYLGYNPKTMDLTFFGAEEDHHWFSLGWLHVFRVHLKVLIGERKRTFLHVYLRIKN